MCLFHEKLPLKPIKGSYYVFVLYLAITLKILRYVSLRSNKYADIFRKLYQRVDVRFRVVSEDLDGMHRLDRVNRFV